MSKNTIDPETWKKVIKVAIAILSAIAGALGASAAYALNLFH